jgi:predicted AAA+ superfamily ATPase
MLAHLHGQLWNASRLAGSLGVSATTVSHYLDVLESTYMLRRLPPWSGNVGKRLTKSPRVYLRDAGLLHALLGITSLSSLQGHPILGASWEGWVLEQLLSRLPSAARGFWSALADLRARGYVVAPIAERFPLGPEVEAIPVSAAIELFGVE